MYTPKKPSAGFRKKQWVVYERNKKQTTRLAFALSVAIHTITRVQYSVQYSSKLCFELAVQCCTYSTVLTTTTDTLSTRYNCTCLLPASTVLYSTKILLSDPCCTILYRLTAGLANYDLTSFFSFGASFLFYLLRP